MGEVETSAEAHLKALRLPTFLPSTTNWRGNAPPRAWIRGASCNNSASWNCSTVNSGHRAPHQGREVPVTKESGHFRLPVLASVEQEAGAGTGAL